MLQINKNSIALTFKGKEYTFEEIIRLKAIWHHNYISYLCGHAELIEEANSIKINDHSIDIDLLKEIEPNSSKYLLVDVNSLL